jgi:glycosyltransferase involved in cell wall biosynthesis
MSVRSPLFPEGIAAKRIDAVLRYEAEVNNQMDIVFTTSEYLRQCLIHDYGVAPEKVVCIGAGINLDELPEVNDKKDYSNGNILFIGIEFRRKGGYEVLEAFKSLREKIPYATLHIVGPREKPAGVESSPGVVWHGYLSKANESQMSKLRELFSKAALFVMPSLYEPFGIAPLEAMSHCIPCVVSRGWALPEIVPHEMCGRLVNPGSSEELSVVLADLLRNPECLRRFGMAGRKHVERRYTWPAVVDQLQVHISRKPGPQSREAAVNGRFASHIERYDQALAPSSLFGNTVAPELGI